jgi:NADPH:quinone reductase-like Zn-dependent oxidoreductase
MPSGQQRLIQCHSDASQHENGGFASVLVAKGDVQIKTPGNISDEEAATLGISIATVGQGLYRTLQLPLPTEPSTKGEWILIYGGSTATGIFGIQFAKLSGFKVVTTASPHNFDYLKSLGADAVFDYHSPSTGSDIHKLTDDKLKLVWDCVGSGTVMSAEALSSQGGKYATIIPVADETVKEAQRANPKMDGPHRTLMYTIFGEYFKKAGTEYPPNADEFEYAKKFWEIARELLEQGKLKTVRPIVNRGGSGLEGVLHGLEELKAGKVSAGKLVYTL